MLLHLLGHVRPHVPRPRANPCRRSAHAWTDMASPPACLRCGRSSR